MIKTIYFGVVHGSADLCWAQLKFRSTLNQLKFGSTLHVSFFLDQWANQDVFFLQWGPSIYKRSFRVPAYLMSINISLAKVSHITKFKSKE